MGAARERDREGFEHARQAEHIRREGSSPAYPARDARRQEGRQAPLAFIKRDTEAGAAMRRLDQMGMIGAIYKEGNPYVVEVLAKGYSYVLYRF